MNFLIKTFTHRYLIIKLSDISQTAFKHNKISKKCQNTNQWHGHGGGHLIIVWLGWQSAHCYTG